MSKKIWMSFVLDLAFTGLIAGSYLGLAANVSAVSTVTPQNVLTGEWKASLVKDNTKLNLNFELRNDNSGRHQIGQSYDFAELGLTREQVQSGGPAKFSLVREAGTIECEGAFENSKGSGTFRFTGSQAFVSAMKSRGFDFEKESRFHNGRGLEERLFTAAAVNVTTALADDLASAGFKLDVDDLFKAAIFKIDSAFMREMKATGFPNLSMEDLVKARIFKIDADFVRQATQMGFDKQPFESLVKMSIFKVTPQFIAEVRNEGLTDLSVEDVVKLRIFKIDAEFIRKAKAEGIPLNVERLVQRRLGVNRVSRRVVI
jgi:hypothetical protein